MRGRFFDQGGSPAAPDILEDEGLPVDPVEPAEALKLGGVRERGDAAKAEIGHGDDRFGQLQDRALRREAPCRSRPRSRGHGVLADALSAVR